MSKTIPLIDPSIHSIQTLFNTQNMVSGYFGTSVITTGISTPDVTDGSAIITGSFESTGLTVSGDLLLVDGDTVTVNGTLDVNGSAYATHFDTPSDIRLKTDIKKIDNALEKLQSISGYTFTYIMDNKRSAGVLAQEVEKVLPEVVDQRGDFKSVAYGNLLSLLIEAVKELKKEVDDLKTKHT